MAASVNDKFKKTFNAANPETTFVTTARTMGATTIICDNLTGWPDDTAVDFITYQIAGDGVSVEPGTQTDWVGIVSGSTITNIVRKAGEADSGNNVNDIVQMVPTATWANDLVEGLLVSHNKDGTLRFNQSIVQSINDAIIPLGARREYFGTKDTFDDDPARFGWLFMEKDVEYAKTTYQRLYDHLVSVDANSVKDHEGATFKFADKWFGTVGVSVDATQTEFNTLGKNGGSKAMQKHSHVISSTSAVLSGGGSFEYTMYTGGVGGPRNSQESGTGNSGNLQPYNSYNYIIKT